MPCIRTNTHTYRFVVMATDGLWDMISNQEAVDLVLGWMVEDDCREHNYAHLLAEEAYRRSV